jgi:hypothetical protein
MAKKQKADPLETAKRIMGRLVNTPPKPHKAKPAKKVAKKRA